MILADTSVWVDHLRNRNLEMEKRLIRGQIVMHPFIVAEIEVRHMIEAHALYSKGNGLTDAHLIASCLLTPGTQLWTRDSALEKVAKTLGILITMP